MTGPARGSATEDRRLRLAAGLVGLAFCLGLVGILSIAVGARPIAPGVVIEALLHPDPDNTAHVIVTSLRLPRTLLGLLVGMGLGAAGAVMQGVTRNPLADPGILGVNSGAALAVVIGISAFGLTATGQLVWLAFLGAALATAIVYSVAATGREGATPIKLALAGAAVTAAMSSVTSAVLLTRQQTLDEFRFWQVGSLAGRDHGVLIQVAPFLVLGLLLALTIARLLDALALGDDLARGLGQRVQLARVLSGLCWVVLCGAATAAAGPITFIGLTIPHIARAITGPSYRWIVPYSILLGPILLLGADIVGRVLVSPGELQVGIVTAALGAPVFIALVRHRRLATL